MINIRGGLCLVMKGFFLEENYQFFPFRCLNGIVDLIPIFPSRLHREVFCFVKCSIVIPNHLLNKLLCILRLYCDK